jgi:ribosome-associated protein YbcJ (S4-like RNA binding protein)
VLVDGAVETRIRRKLRAGQTVRIGEQRIGIAAPNTVDDGKAVQ